MRKFKCVENKKHVKAAKVTKKNLMEITCFFMYFKLDSYLPKRLAKQVASLRKNASSAKCHDIAHKLLDCLLKAVDANEPAVNDKIFKKFWPAMRDVQQKCKIGEDHETGK